MECENAISDQADYHWFQFSHMPVSRCEFQVKSIESCQECKMEILARWKHDKMLPECPTEIKMWQKPIATEKFCTETIDKKIIFWETKSSCISTNMAGGGMGRSGLVNIY